MEADGNLSSGSFWRPYTTIDRGFAGYSSMLSAVPEASNRVHVAYDSGNESAAEGALDPERATAGGAVTFRTAGSAFTHIPFTLAALALSVTLATLAFSRSRR